ncbi:hypothetical protein KQX54_018331 [Cotesia glomerata]|uniref:Uncharacterized protein n=1 Tax=Cotesia glomerata TaxID=32391 RepID=A0AAV7IT73_COTGL|nr:hypothetical protein KQX54_018331 [Cotesia glomerata]
MEEICEDLRIDFSEFKQQRCIILTHQDTRIFLLAQTTNTLKRINQSVNHWLDHLEQLPIGDYINSIEENISRYILKNLVPNARETPNTNTILKYFEKHFLDLFKYNERTPSIHSNLGDLGFSFFWELLHYHEEFVQKIVHKVDNHLSQRYSLYYNANEGQDTCY